MSRFVSNVISPDDWIGVRLELIRSRFFTLVDRILGCHDENPAFWDMRAGHGVRAKARRRMFILGALGVAVPISRLFRTERFELLQLFRDRDLGGKSLDIGGSEEASGR